MQFVLFAKAQHMFLRNRILIYVWFRYFNIIIISIAQNMRQLNIFPPTPIIALFSVSFNVF